MFITFEGCEGTGKTTVINKVYESLKNEGIDCILTREPGGVEIAEQIREVILSVNNDLMDERTEALLYAASRRQHLVEKVIPALEKGQVILCDRFLDSSLAYQGFARGIGIEDVLSINLFAIDDVMPDLTIYFDLDPLIGLERINQSKSREVNRLDLENNEFHNRVYEGYEKIQAMYKDRFESFDASKSIDENVQTVLSIIKNKIKK